MGVVRWEMQGMDPKVAIPIIDMVEPYKGPLPVIVDSQPQDNNN